MMVWQLPQEVLLAQKVELASAANGEQSKLLIFPVAGIVFTPKLRDWTEKMELDGPAGDFSLES